MKQVISKDLFWSKQDLEEMKMKGKASQGKITWLLERGEGGNRDLQQADWEGGEEETRQLSEGPFGSQA